MFDDMFVFLVRYFCDAIINSKWMIVFSVRDAHNILSISTFFITMYKTAAHIMCWFAMMNIRWLN